MNEKPEVLVVAPLPSFLRTSLEAAYICHDWHAAPDKEALIAEVGARIRGLVPLGGTVVPVSLLEHLPNLEIVSVMGVGYDGVPIPWCQEQGVRVTNTPDVLTDDVADIAVALVLMTSRRLVESNRHLHEGKWLRGAFPLAHALRGKVAGIVGLGRIGKAIALRLEAHGMKIAYYGRAPQNVNYSYMPTVLELAASSDFLIVACPGGPETRHLINADVLTQLGAEGTLINIARGSVVDEAALIAALQAGTIRTAGLDVFEDEPRVPAELLSCQHTVLLPHVGSATHETRREMGRLVFENLAAQFAGRDLITTVC